MFCEPGLNPGCGAMSRCRGSLAGLGATTLLHWRRCAEAAQAAQAKPSPAHGARCSSLGRFRGWSRGKSEGHWPSKQYRDEASSGQCSLSDAAEDAPQFPATPSGRVRRGLARLGAALADDPPTNAASCFRLLQVSSRVAHQRAAQSAWRRASQR